MRHRRFLVVGWFLIASGVFLIASEALLFFAPELEFFGYAAPVALAIACVLLIAWFAKTAVLRTALILVIVMLVIRFPLNLLLVGITPRTLANLVVAVLAVIAYVAVGTFALRQRMLPPAANVWFAIVTFVLAWVGALAVVTYSIILAANLALLQVDILAVGASEVLSCTAGVLQVVAGILLLRAGPEIEIGASRVE